MNNIYI